jgi:hypothetical protein
MSEVSKDQDWGVTAAGESQAVVKYGWLPHSADHSASEVNSIGINTVNGQSVLIAVLTRYGASEADGIDLVEQISKFAVGAVT